MRTSILLAASFLVPPLALTAQREVDFLRSHPLQWGAASAGGGARARAAVIVMADRYEHQAFDAPSAKRSGEVLRDALVQHGGFARGAIRELSGEQVHEGALESAIRAAAASIGDGAGVTEGTLLVLWVGHGFTAGTGPNAEQELFTYYTAPSGDGFAPTLGLRKLKGWLDAAHAAAKQRGVDLAMALVMDACKPNIKAPPRNAKLVSSKAWQVSSATDGQFALGRGPSEPMLFSQAFADALALRAKQSGAADLQQVFLEARDKTLQLTQNAQRPQILEPSDAELAKRKLMVVVPRRVGFTVRLVDALAGGRIEQAKLRLDDQVHEVREHRLALAAAPGTHQLEAAVALGKTALEAIGDDLGVGVAEAPEERPAPVSAGQRIETGIGLAMIRIEAQEFVMGSPAHEADRDGDEQQHRVKITKPYWIGETEVTRKQWREVMRTKPWSDTAEGDDTAASDVSWNDAMDFCRKLTERERAAGRLPAGYRYILPTEAEWELACRAGSKTAYCFGDDVTRLGEYAVFKAASSGGYVERVRQRKPNSWGLYDMHGNLWEWCLDSADPSSDHQIVSTTYRDDVSDPCNTSGSQRVLRGGCWGASNCRSAERTTNQPGRVYIFLGFRPALAARSDVK